MNKKRNFVNLGFSSVLMVFVTVTFLTFGVLSVLTANADYKLTQKTSTRTLAYYDAENKAEAITAEIDQILVSIYESTSAEASYYSAAQAHFTNTNDFSAAASPLDHFNWQDTEAGNPCIQFNLRISDLQILSIELEITYPDTANDYTCYQVKNWKTITDPGNTSPDTETLHLFGNES